MLRPRWRKVLADIWSNKSRTLLVVLAIAVGVFAIGTVAGTRILLSRDLTDAYLAENPSQISIVTDPFDDEFVNSLRSMREIGEIEGKRDFTARLQIGPEKWQNIQIFAIPDFRNIRINKTKPISGAWPPAKGEFLIERASLDLTGAKVGEKLLIELPDGKQKEMTMSGVVHTVNLAPAQFMNTAYAYITYDTLEWLGYPRTYMDLNITVTGDWLDKDHVKAVADAVQEKVEKSGRKIHGVWIPPAGKHPADEMIQPLLLVLGVLGSLSMVASGFLVINTIGAVLAQQVKQIGIMKAVGARTGQIASLYLSTVLAYGLLALLIAVPLGALGARWSTAFLASIVNFDVVSSGFIPSVLALEVTVGLVVPLLASLIPIFVTTRVSVREAISDVGISGGGGKESWFDRLLYRVRFLSRPLLLSLRNTFRRKGRLALTLIALTLGGSLFISVVSVREALLVTLDEAFEYFRYDAQIYFRRPYRLDAIEQVAVAHADVVKVESWGRRGGTRIRPDKTESKGTRIMGVPAGTEMLEPKLLQGRWLLPEDENAIVVNSDLTRDETDLKVGDSVVFKIDGEEFTYQVVGIVRGVMAGPIAYINFSYFARMHGEAGRATTAQVVTRQHDEAATERVATELKEAFQQSGFQISGTYTTASEKRTIQLQFNLLIAFLMIMAVLLATVGGLGLMGTMSINVLERTREIGVMRAIGASDGSVLRIFLTEGILIGLLSWLLAAVVAIPIGRMLCDMVGESMLLSPLPHLYSTTGALLWLGLVLVIAAFSSLFPSWRAARLTVRDVLSYE